ncbi:MAG: hypothetical protein ACRENJ_11530 [Candidatus Eiseniibacteriota bacterium]
MKHPVIQKLRASVRLSQPGESPVDGYLCLAPEVEGERRPETILELLNSSRRVIPFLRGADESVGLLTRLNIDWVVVGGQVDPAWVMPKRFPAMREQSVRLQFSDGRTMEGDVRWPSPAATDIRLSDFLNDPADFFPLATRVGIMMVNKNRVRETRVGLE